MSKWISVKDAEPEIDGYYLVTGNDIELEICPFDSDWGWQDDFDITHWMPIPELPK